MDHEKNEYGWLQTNHGLRGQYGRLWNIGQALCYFIGLQIGVYGLQELTCLELEKQHFVLYCRVLV